MTEQLTALANGLGAYPNLALVIVFLVSMGEAVIVIGLFMPSTVVLVGAGALIATGSLSFWPIFIAATLGAIAGDALSFWVGHTYRERLKTIWPISRYASLVTMGEAYVRQHGAKSIFVGRFIPAIKSIVPAIAGMLRMDVRTFAVINVISAFAWSAAHILPGMGAGKGLARFWQADPRLALVLGTALAAALILWYVTKIGVRVMSPALAGARRHAILELSCYHQAVPSFIVKVLRNEAGLVISLFWSLTAVGLLIGFVAVLLNVMFDPEIAAADHAFSGLLQTLRSPPVDDVMVAITMAGDGVVLSVVAVILILWLLFHRRRKIAASAALAFFGSMAFVPLLKTVLQRARPTPLYAGADAYSFPSGHATLSATVFGIIAIILAQNLPIRPRLLIYFAALLAIGAIGTSRIYLQAHWPSDVLAGFAFGLSVVAAFAFFLHRQVIRIHARWLALALLLGFSLAYGLHYGTSAQRYADVYAYTPNVSLQTRADWRAGGWHTLPDARITFDGERDDPLFLQAAVPVGRLRATLEAAGWTIETSGRTTQLLDAVLPSRAPLAARSTLPRYHDGRPPALTVSRPAAEGAGQRIVLRFWRSDVAIKTDRSASADSEILLLLADASLEELDPLLFGWSEVESTPGLGLTETTTLLQDLSTAFETEDYQVTSPAPGRLLLYGADVEPRR